MIDEQFDVLQTFARSLIDAPRATFGVEHCRFLHDLLAPFFVVRGPLCPGHVSS